MPRPNAARKAASAQPQKKAQPDDELDEAEQHEAFNEVDDAHSGVNSEPASPSKIVMAGDTTQPNWIIRNIAELVRFSRRKTTLEEPQDARAVEEEEELERNESPIREGRAPEPSTPRAQPEAAKSTALKSPNRAAGSSVNPAKRKRASDSERQDLYEVPVETATHDSELEEAPTYRSTKRARRNGKAKPPLTIPKTSKAYTSSHHTHRARRNSTAESEELEKTADARRSSPVNRATNTTESEPRKPRKRGRPPKNKNLPLEAVQDNAIPTPKKTQPAHHAVAKSVAATNRPGIALQVPDGINKGFSDTLLDPNPIKVVRQAIQRAAPATQKQKSHKPNGRVTTATVMPELSADENGSEDDDKAEEYPDDIEFEAEEAADQALDKVRKTPFDPQIIDKMWETSKHVGKRFEKGGKTWSQVRKEEKLSDPGIRMMKELRLLISGYEKLQESNRSRDKRAFEVAHEELEKAIHILSVQTKTLVTKKFGPGANTDEAVNSLKDLYFSIIPQCIHTLKKAVAAYNIQGSMATAALQEILKLVDLLHELATAAVTQPKEIQPRPVGSISYQISQPTRYNLKDIRNLKKSILTELSLREREQEWAEEELWRPQRERRLQELREREDAEIRRKRNERHRLQGEFWRAVQNDFFPRPWNRVLQTDIARLEAARKGKGRQESVELGNPRMRMVEARRGNSEESRPGSDQNVERVSVFPANNVKANSSMSLLSKEDTLIFIDCMRYEQGADRYERAAEQIGRSMDEVFAFAKEFQEAMDLQHQEGNFDEARDGWTYSVWVE